MDNNILLIFFVFLSSYFLTWMVRNYALRRSIVDIPNERSSHTKPTPRAGGIAIAITWFVSISYLALFRIITPTLYFALLGGIPISIIGIIDDLVNVSPRIRLSIQALSVILALFFLGGLKLIDFGFFQISNHVILSITAFIGLLWMVNLYNFLDGIDGYAASEIMFVGLASFILFGAFPPFLLAITVAGFIIWNWQPAKIFMGDVGSTLLGYNIGIFAIYYQNTGEASLIIWIILTSLFWFDATLTLFRRWRNHEELSKAHKKHAYQRIVQAGFSHQKTVLYTLLLNFLLFGLAWCVYKFISYSLLFIGVDVIFMYAVMKYVDKKKPFSFSN